MDYLWSEGYTLLQIDLQREHKELENTSDGDLQ